MERMGGSELRNGVEDCYFDNFVRLKCVDGSLGKDILWGSCASENLKKNRNGRSLEGRVVDIPDSCVEL